MSGQLNGRPWPKRSKDMKNVLHLSVPVCLDLISPSRVDSQENKKWYDADEQQRAGNKLKTENNDHKD